MKIKITLLLVLSLSILNSKAQTVTTILEGNFHDGLALDSQGNLYGSDFPPSGSQSVYKYDTNGNVTVFATGFVSPNGIGINSQNEIYICDHFGNAVKKYDLNGTLLANYNTGQFSTPAGIKPIPNTLDMLVVEYSNTTGRKIKRLAADGTVTTLFSGAPLNGPAGITFIEETPYIANFNDRKIFRFENETLTEIAQLPSSNNSQTDFLGFLTSANGILYATHFGLNSIYTINSTTGEINLFAGSSDGGQDGDISVATFSGPNGILADESTGKIYVSDAGSQGTVKNLRIIDNAFLSTEDFTIDKVIVDIFPNPTKDNLYIELNLKSMDSIQIKIFDITGKSVYKEDIIPNKVNLSIFVTTSNWQKGNYVLQYVQNDKRITKKFIL